MFYVQGCQYPCNKGRFTGFLGLLYCTPACCSTALVKKTSQTASLVARPAPLCPPPGHREDYSVVCSVYTVKKT
eukprot:1162143-Pelagomonas_calceolata.AAC.16